MNKEDKSLLLKDLCARLPYGVIIDSKKYNEAHYRKHYVQRLILVSVLREEVTCIDVDDYPDPKCREHKLEYCKPYLRPMSSMTDEELDELLDCEDIDFDGKSELVKRAMLAFAEGDKLLSNALFSMQYAKTVDWLNAHHFDYRGLIEKGLAIKAPEDMYKTE